MLCQRKGASTYCQWRFGSRRLALKDGILVCTHAETQECVFKTRCSRILKVTLGSSSCDDAIQETDNNKNISEMRSLHLQFAPDYTVTLRFNDVTDAAKCHTAIENAIHTCSKSEHNLTQNPSGNLECSTSEEAQRLLAIQERLMLIFDEADDDLDATGEVLAWLVVRLDHAICSDEGSIIDLNQHLRIIHPMVIMKMSMCATDTAGMSLSRVLAVTALISGFVELIQQIKTLFPRLGPLYVTDFSQELSFLSKRYSDESRPHFESMSTRLILENIKSLVLQRGDGLVTTNAAKELEIFAERYCAEARSGSQLLLARCLNLVVTSLIGSYRSKLESFILAPLCGQPEWLDNAQLTSEKDFKHDPAFLLASANEAMALSDLIENMHEHHAEAIEAFPDIELSIENENKCCVKLAKECTDIIAGDFFAMDISEISSNLATCSRTGDECRSAIATVYDYIEEFTGDHLDSVLTEKFIEETFLRLVVLVVTSTLASGLAQDPKLRVTVGKSNKEPLLWLQRDMKAMRALALELNRVSRGVSKIAKVFEWFETLLTANIGDNLAHACTHISGKILEFAQKQDSNQCLAIKASGYAFISQCLLCRDSHIEEATFQCQQLSKVKNLFGISPSQIDEHEETSIGIPVETGRGLGRALRMICPLCSATILRDQRGPKKRFPTKKSSLHAMFRPKTQIYGGFMIINVHSSIKFNTRSHTLLTHRVSSIRSRKASISGKSARASTKTTSNVTNRTLGNESTTSSRSIRSSHKHQSSLTVNIFDQDRFDADTENVTDHHLRTSSLDLNNLENELLGGLDEIDENTMNPSEGKYAADYSSPNITSNTALESSLEDTLIQRESRVPSVNGLQEKGLVNFLSDKATSHPLNQPVPTVSYEGGNEAAVQARSRSPPKATSALAEGSVDICPPSKPAPKPDSAVDETIAAMCPPNKPAPKPITNVGKNNAAINPSKKAARKSYFAAGEANAGMCPPNKPAPKPVTNVGKNNAAINPPKKPAPKPNFVIGEANAVMCPPNKPAPEPITTVGNDNSVMYPPNRPAPKPFETKA